MSVFTARLSTQRIVLQFNRLGLLGTPSFYSPAFRLTVMQKSVLLSSRQEAVPFIWRNDSYPRVPHWKTLN